MLGSNIKVHFAGSEQINIAMCAQRAGVKYFLFTCFPFLSPAFGIKGYPITVKTLFPPHEIAKFSKHTIMDSGLFTLMFGAHAGKRDEAFLWKWQEMLCDFVNTNKIKATCVEVDCQKVLGVEQAWKFRHKLRDMLPNNRQINVFHIEDGQKGLDRLIEFSDYIAISVPELRIAKRKTYRQDVHRLACYVKNRKPEIDIHLLGCTEGEMLRQNNFCTSSDSTAWEGVNRFGSIEGYHVSRINKELRERFTKEALSIMEYCKIEPSDVRIRYYVNFSVSAYISLMKYKQYAGNQD